MKAWSRWRRAGHRRDPDAGAAGDAPPFDVSPNDPLMAYLQASPRAVALRDLDLRSPALDAMRAAGVELLVPLVTQGELVGVLNLGARRSERPYSVDDRRLLDNLAGNAAAAIRVAQLVREQAAEARARERIDQELRVAHVIQQQFLPRQAPTPEGWSVAPRYRPAREVGGDFYDFLALPDGRLGLVIGDVTDKGVPAAMVMATTHSILRTDAPRLVEPGAVLARTNDLLCAEMPPNMFVTCLYGVLDLATGTFRFANAGHNLPCVRTDAGILEPRATGMPLGLMPGLAYDEHEVTLSPGDSLVLYSDGIVEAHGPEPQHDLFGFPRLRSTVAAAPAGADLIATLETELAAFTGPRWEQEDDITIVVVRRAPLPPCVLTSFTLPSDVGNEREAADRVVAAVTPLALESAAVDRLRTAVAEAAMNAIEHGNHSYGALPVEVTVAASARALSVKVVDRGGRAELHEPETPDIVAKLAGEQSPRGWGLFLMRQMVDDVVVSTDGERRTVELRLQLPIRKE
jgi:serine phosphatase RsbU (regulator of sigma subunit)/anti-sigma regulatory factor (Ser/Thr protein kinase)